MKRFRSVLFWTHLTAGVLAGVVILVMSFTGVVLALKPQIQNWIDRDVRYVQDGGTRLTPHTLLTAVAAQLPQAQIQSVALDRDPEMAATVSLGRDGNVYVNPYTGAVLGPQNASSIRFFQSMTTWHRYMGASGESRATGRAFTGASNLAFLVLGISGLYLWWPKTLTAKHLRAIVWFRRTSTGKARDFNWHNTIGFWTAIPIIVMTASGVVMSYQWGNNLVYRLTGSPLPAARGAAPAGRASAEGGRPAATRDAGGADGGRVEGGRAAVPRDGGRADRGDQDASAMVIPASVDLLVARAEQQVPAWSQLTLRLPNRDGAPVQFTLVDGAQWNSFARSQLTLNGTTGEVQQWQPYESQSLGQKVRGWLRFAHTGELGGLAGQIVAGLGCLGGVFLVATGLSLAVRRLWNWSIWKRTPTNHGSRETSRPPAETAAFAPASATHTAGKPFLPAMEQS